jgi:hypothetical protein
MADKVCWTACALVVGLVGVEIVLVLELVLELVFASWEMRAR